MKTENDVLNIIAAQLQSAINASGKGEDYHWIICTERVFLDDYKPKVDDYIESLNVPIDDGSYDIEATENGYENPLQMPYQKTIFVILNMGQGQMNFAVWNCPVTMKIVSEENDFGTAREAFTQFMADVNFKYIGGIIQSYFTPEMSTTMAEMYAGFRGILMCRGFVRVPEDGIVFATKVMVDMGDGFVDYPFVNIAFDHSGQPDVQASAGHGGATMSLNRMTTQAISVGTYLWWGEEIEDAVESEDIRHNSIIEFSKAVLRSMNNMNKRFKLAVISNIPDDESDNVDGYLPIINATFVLTGAHYSQEWGDLSTWSLTFSRAEEL